MIDPGLDTGQRPKANDKHSRFVQLCMLSPMLGWTSP
jgi:hypothetical protein